MRRQLTYANVAATLALVFSMTGGALAAKHYLINSTRQINPKVLAKLKGRAGATGQEGKQGKEGPPGKDALLAPLAWTPMTLEHGWIEFPEPYGTPSFAKDAQGFVHLSGAIDGEKETSLLVTILPAGFRPTRAPVIWLRAGATNGEGETQLDDLEIEGNGDLAVRPGVKANKKFVSLEGLEFYAG
jgi:hypothetical protein